MPDGTYSACVCLPPDPEDAGPSEDAGGDEDAGVSEDTGGGGGGTKGAWSATSDGITIDTTDPGAPGTPVGAGGASMTFTWTEAADAQSGISSYEIEVCDDCYGTCSNIIDVIRYWERN